MAKDYIPQPDADFFNFQRNIITLVTPNIVPWGIPAPALAVLTGRQATYEPLYVTISNKDNRTSADVTAHRQSRTLYEGELRQFTGQYLTKNTAITDAQRQQMGLTVRDTTPTPRPAISTSPVAKLSSGPGARIEVTCRVDGDSSRSSIHPDADVIEVAYVVSTSAPKNPQECTKIIVSSKAKFSVQADIAEAGKKMFAYMRWKNNTSEDKSGPWTSVLSATVAD